MPLRSKEPMGVKENEKNVFRRNQQPNSKQKTSDKPIPLFKRPGGV